MKLYLVFAIVAAFIFATASIFSKHFLNIEVEDYVFTGAVFGLPFFLLYLSLGFLKGFFIFETYFTLGSFSAGALYSVILILYLKGLSEEEASRFIPTMALNTVFLAFLSFFLLNQTFSLFEYFGMFLAVLGSIIISLENPLESIEEFDSKIGTFLAFGVAVLIAFRDTLIEFATMNFELWSALIWMGLGGLTVSIATIFIFRRDKLNFLSFIEQKKMVGTGVLRSFGFLTYIMAISLGPAAKASAVLKLNGMFVFIAATLIGVFRPSFIVEDTNTKKVVQKFIASLLIIIGVLLVQ